MSNFDVNIGPYQYKAQVAGYGVNIGPFQGAFAPVITDQSTDMTVGVGEPVSLWVTAIGSFTLSYQWYKDGNPVGTDSSTYFFLATESSAGTYTCTVSNVLGHADSADMDITVTAPTEAPVTSPSQMMELLAEQKKVRICELYELTLRNGTELYFTSHSEDILWGANSKRYISLPIARGPVSVNLSMEVGTLQTSMTGLPQSILDQLSKGILRDARVKVKRIAWGVNFRVGMERVIFDGWANVSYDEITLAIECTSIIDCLNQQIPRFAYQEPCNHRLYDGFCQVNKTALKTSSTCTSDSTDLYHVLDSAFTVPVDDTTYYIRGEVVVTSGDNAGERKMIYATEDGIITVSSPFNYPMKNGDTFDYYPGCDLTPDTCLARFNNLNNRLGFNFIPNQEDVLF